MEGMQFWRGWPLKFKVPLLVAQGANDPRVKKAESDQIVQALEKRGIDVHYMVKNNEGHGFANEENRFEFYRTMEIFLGQHLEVRWTSGQPEYSIIIFGLITKAKLTCFQPSMQFFNHC